MLNEIFAREILEMSIALGILDGTTITNSISFKKLRLLEPTTNYLIERM